MGPAGGYASFEARIVPLRWGEATYTILPLPTEVMEALGHPKRVEGEIGEHPVNMGVARADPAVLEGPFLYAGKAFLAEAGIEPGEAVEVRLRPADPDAVEMPEGLEAVIRGAGLLEAWEALSPGKRRGLVHPVRTAKRAETRERRVAALLAALAIARAGR